MQELDKFNRFSMRLIIKILTLTTVIIVSACDLEREPRFWEADDYMVGDKPDGVEYLYCGYINVLLEVFPEQGFANAYEYSTTDAIAVNRHFYNQLPEANFVESITKLTKLRDDSSIYTSREDVWTGAITGCGSETLYSETRLGPGGEGYIGHLVFERSFSEISMVDTFACRASQGIIQSEFESKAKNKTGKYPKKGSCVFMPDTHSFNSEKKLLRDKYRELALTWKRKSLERIEEKEREEAEQKARDKEVTKGKI